MAFVDGYWEVLCDNLNHSETVDELRYYATMNRSENVYKTAKEDIDYRKRLIGRCYGSGNDKNVDYDKIGANKSKLLQYLPD